MMDFQPFHVKERYADKLNLYCDGVDPFSIPQQQLNANNLPKNVQYFDILEYCLNKASPYTKEAFQAYKSLSAYKLFENGWVQELKSKILKNGKCLVLSKVKHSQKLNDAPVKCWVVVDNNGVILCAHCQCIAGLDEVCSHTAAILFALEEWSRVPSAQDEKSCTDILCSWLVAPLKKVGMVKVKDMVWRANKSPKQNKVLLPAFSEAEKLQLMQKFEQNNESCVACSFIKPPKIPERTNESEECISNNKFLNLLLVQLYETEYSTKDLQFLQKCAEEINLSYTEEEINFIEAVTRRQSKCDAWRKLRAGRVTASIFKSVCRTSIATPSLSLLKKICYPHLCEFSSSATRHGCKHEEQALAVFKTSIAHHHKNFTTKTTGLIINNDYPHLGASPDAIAYCECCGNSVVEIKCPYCLRDGSSIYTYAKNKNSPLQISADGSYQLKDIHQYYYQVQMQMFVVKCNFGYFVVWTPKEMVTVVVKKNEKFWNIEYPKTQQFFQKAILPELLGNYYTSKKSV